MTPGIAHGFEEESLEAKVAWFRSLSVIERLRNLDSFYRLAVAVNPNLREGRDVERAEATVRVLEFPRR
jgi:hypothetical protein